MNILIAGASGFVGQCLVEALQQEHHITVLGRSQQTLQDVFLNTIKHCTWNELYTLNPHEYDVIINLCGHNIAASRWTEDIKQKIIDSRVTTSQTLSQWIMSRQAKPRFLCANAVGIYGLQDNGELRSLDEDSFIDLEHPCDYMSDIGIRWQNALQPLIEYGVSVTTLRFGVVLKKHQGMLKKLFLSFYCGLGSVVGEGTQMISWIHIEDLVNAIIFLLQRPELSGAFNLTSPKPVTQAEFSHTLAHVMHRPLFLKMPAMVIRWLFGEMGECLLLKGQRVVPKRLLDAGYVFHYPELKNALHREFGS
ncbi:MAG: TIGR01777 family protein [Legionella sp.]|nr:MAG: TIGR01777 family protein [Legionella sp.]